MPHRPGYVQAMDSGAAITFFQDRTSVATITEDDLAKLDGDSRLLIVTLEKSMRQYYTRWNDLELKISDPQLPVAQALEDEETLNAVRSQMCLCLERILDFLTSLNIRLADHYYGVRAICKGFR